MTLWCLMMFQFLFPIMCAGSPLCAKGLLQDLRQHRASSWDSGATFHRFLWMPRWAKRTQLINRPASFYFSVFVLLNVWSLPAFVSLSLRSVFRRAPRVYTGPHDWCNQELLPEVHAPQPDMSRTLKLSARTSSFVQPAALGGSHQTLKSSPFICHRPEALSLISQEKKHHVLKSDSVAQSYHVLASPNFWEIKWNPVRCHSDALPCPLHHGEKLVDPLCGLWSLPSLPDGSLRAAADEDEEVEELRRMQEHGF